MLKKQLLILLLIFCAHKLNAQSIILVANGGGLYSLDINSVSCITKPVSAFGCNGSPFSAALFKDTLYYTGIDPLTNANTLFQNVFGNNSYCKKFRIYGYPNNLTVDSAGIVYWIDNGPIKSLFSLNPRTGATSNHGRVYFDPAGDLIFYKSKLYLAASSAGLVEINIQNPEESKVYMGTGDHSFFGLINIPVGCNKNQVFGVETNEKGESKLIAIDMEKKKIGSIFCSIPFDVYDAASITETGIVKGIYVNSISVHPDCSLSGHSGSITINALSASPGKIRVFLNGKSTDNTGFFKNLSTGFYNFHIVSPDGCIVDTVVEIKQSAQINLSIKILADTCNTNKGAISINPSGNYGLLTYYLNNQVQPSNSYNNLAAGTYKLSVQDTNQCRIDSTVFIQNTILPLSISSINIEAATCRQHSGKINIDATAALPLSFSLNNGNPQTSGLFTALDTGIYHLRIFESYCEFDTTIMIPQQQSVKPDIAFNVLAPNCFNRQNGSLKINVSNVVSPFTISIDNSPFSNNDVYLNLNAGTHLIKVVDFNSCEWDTSAIVPSYFPIKPQISYSVKNPQCWQSSFGAINMSITGTENPYYFFMNDNQYSSQATNLLPGDYLVKILNNDKCEVDSLHVLLSAENNGYNCDTMYVPSAFTPNNDGLNDLLKPIIANFPTYILFQVFNRFGENIFSTTKPNEGWNGIYKGQSQPSGTYIWTCNYSTISGTKKYAKGTAVLIR